MPLQYIEVIYTNNVEGLPDKFSRKFVVLLNKTALEQVYYLSSMTNSNVKQWLPCMMKRCFYWPVQAPINADMDKLYSGALPWSTTLIEMFDCGYIIKIERFMYRSPDNSLTTENVTSTEFNYSYRLPKKSHLIISSRLSLSSKAEDKVEGYSSELLQKLGLNQSEIKEALTPLELENTPRAIFHLDGLKNFIAVDQINQWLADQGAEIAQQIIDYQQKQFNDFELIWQEAEKTNEEKDSKTEPSSKQVLQAKQILTKQYTKGSWSSRFFSLAWNHNHISVINAILKENHLSLTDLTNSLFIKVKESGKTINQSGQLMKCLYFIFKKNNKIAGNNNNPSKDELRYNVSDPATTLLLN